MSSPTQNIVSENIFGIKQKIDVLYIDDEPYFFDLFKNRVEGSDKMISVETAKGASSGLDIITDNPPDCVVADYNMPDMDGLELLAAVREEHPNLPFILYTGQGNETIASQAAAADVTDYLNKDTDPEHYDHLCNLIRTVVERQRAKRIKAQKQELTRRTEIAGRVGGFELNLEEDITLVTDGARQILEFSKDADISRDRLINQFDAGDQDEIQHAIDQVLTRGDTVQKTFTNLYFGNERRSLQITFQPKPHEDTKTIVQGIIQDVTYKREKEEQIKVFYRVLRHNLRNNLNMIRGPAELIKSEATGDIADYSEQIIEESELLNNIITKQRHIMDILGEEPKYENITVKSVLQEVISDMISKYPKAELTVECPSELSVRASIRLRQALEELVENAIEHNDSRTPEVQISAAQNEDTVKIDIADNGPKIPSMEQNVLAKPKERSPLYHGSGLGLWLVKLIVSRSNGQIAFDQNSRAGNIICIKLPKSM